MRIKKEQIERGRGTPARLEGKLCIQRGHRAREHGLRVRAGNSSYLQISYSSKCAFGLCLRYNYTSSRVGIKQRNMQCTLFRAHATKRRTKGCKQSRSPSRLSTFEELQQRKQCCGSEKKTQEPLEMTLCGALLSPSLSLSLSLLPVICRFKSDVCLPAA